MPAWVSAGAYIYDSSDQPSEHSEFQFKEWSASWFQTKYVYVFEICFKECFSICNCCVFFLSSFALCYKRNFNLQYSSSKTLQWLEQISSVKHYSMFYAKMTRCLHRLFHYSVFYSPKTGKTLRQVLEYCNIQISAVIYDILKSSRKKNISEMLNLQHLSQSRKKRKMERRYAYFPWLMLVVTSAFR